MEFLTDPNFAYVILMLSFFATILALLSPGTGIIEVTALMGFLGSIRLIYLNPIRIWALILMLISLLLLLISIRKVKRWWLLLFALFLFLIGSIFLFKQHGKWIAVNPFLALLTAGIGFPALWWIGRKGLEAIWQTPQMDLSQLIGEVGYARSTIHQHGTVYVAGEEWSAHSKSPIPAGTRVKVIQRDGLVVLVEPIDSDQQQEQIV